VSQSSPKYLLFFFGILPVSRAIGHSFDRLSAARRSLSLAFLTVNDCWCSSLSPSLSHSSPRYLLFCFHLLCFAVATGDRFDLRGAHFTWSLSLLTFESSSSLSSMLSQSSPRTLVFLFRLLRPLRIIYTTRLGHLMLRHGGGRSSFVAIKPAQNHFCTGASVAPLVGDNTIYIGRILYFFLSGIVWRRMEKVDFGVVFSHSSVTGFLRWGAAVVFEVGRRVRPQGPCDGPARSISFPFGEQHGVVL